MTMFEHFDIRKEENGPFIIASKDREVTNKIRWVLNPTTEEEAKRLYMYLQDYFKQQENEV